MSVDALSQRSRLERNWWAAIVDLESGYRHEAVQRASMVVGEAQEEGHVRLFVDAGRPAERLLRLLSRECPTPYVNRLLREFRSGPYNSDTLFGLSERELEVVRYLPTPLSSAEIASQLFISMNTLKTHLRSIYRKLQVGSRSEANRHVERLGLA